MLYKTGKESTLRANTGYSYSKTTYDYQSFKDYYNENGSVIIHQEQASASYVHRPTLSLEYKLNSSDRYLTNTFTGNAGFYDQTVTSVFDEDTYHQHENLKDILLRNDFTSKWCTGNLRWNLTSRVEFGSTPKGRINVVGKDKEDGFVQSARSHHWLTKETFSLAYEHRRSRWWMPLSVLYSNNVLKSVLDSPAATNDAVDNNVQLCLSPQYEYIHPMQKYVLRASADVKWEYNHVNNGGSVPVKTSDARFSVNPSLYFYWKIMPSSVLRSQISYQHMSGDLADFLTAPVRTDNLNIACQTGVWSHQKSFNAMLHYDFKLPLDQWFVSADMIYTNARQNVITNSNISSSSIDVSSMSYPNISEHFTGMLNLTKIFSSIRTKVSLGGAYTWTCNAVSQDEILLRQYGRSYSLMLKLIAKPLPFIEFDYDGRLSDNHIKYDNLSYSLLSHSHSLELSLFPLKGFQIKTGADILWKEISEDVSKSIGLWDVGMAYKFSSYRIGVDLNNILNTKHYAYTLFSGINQFSYDYSLRGREVLVSFSITQ